MIQIRQGIFETNSSSVHALTFLTKDQYDGLRSGDLYYDRWSGEFVGQFVVDETDEDERDRYVNASNISEYASEYLNGEGFIESRYLPDGHPVYYLCYYGRD